MYARVTQLEIDVMRIDLDDAAAVFETEVLPDLRRQPGYRGVYVLTTPEGKALLVSLWESAEAADAGAAAGFYAETLERYVTLFRSPPGRERYDVVLSDLPVGIPGA